MVSSIAGWSIGCISDDRAWLVIGDDDRLRAINPRAGMFDLCRDVSYSKNRCIMDTISTNTIFTNVALTAEGDVWWEGLTSFAPAELTDWTGQPWSPRDGRCAAHPNAAYTVAAKQCPILDPDWQNEDGVPITAFVFGGKRFKTVPIIREAFTWDHGMYMGATISVEAADGTVVADPFVMSDSCYYKGNDFLKTWSDLRSLLGYKAPKVFFMNVFRTDDEGRTIWPGYGENIRLVKWLIKRCHDSDEATRTPMGYVPTLMGLDTVGLHIRRSTILELIRVDGKELKLELDRVRGILDTYSNGDTSKAFLRELDRVEKRLDVQRGDAPTTNQVVLQWVEKMVKLCQPESIYWCTGTEEENAELCELMVKSGTFIRLNEQKRPNSFLARSDPRDVARVEGCTYICTKDPDDAGPMNNWADPGEMKQKMLV